MLSLVLYQYVVRLYTLALDIIGIWHMAYGPMGIRTRGEHDGMLEYQSAGVQAQPGHGSSLRCGMPLGCVGGVPPPTPSFVNLISDMKTDKPDIPNKPSRPATREEMLRELVLQHEYMNFLLWRKVRRSPKATSWRF
jgi:hypothetical protein